ncbi:MAG: hypothetical protein JWL64_943, partial [Frankiales bacterium]|nr:hypothetical protein [Frankiales bacterium]
GGRYGRPRLDRDGGPAGGRSQGTVSIGNRVGGSLLCRTRRCV